MSGEHPVDTFELTSYVCGDLSPARTDAVREHVEACDACRMFVARLESERSGFLERYPTADFERRQTVIEGPWTKLRSRALALAAMLALMVGGVVLYRSATPVEHAYRIKGDVDIRMFVQDDSGAVQERSAHVYYPGERVQLTYSCGETDRLILLAIDEQGGVTTYYPRGGDSSIVVAKGQDRPLPHSIELDDYTGKELYVAVFSQKALSATMVREELEMAFEAAGGLPGLAFELGERAHVRTISITKKERRP